MKKFLATILSLCIILGLNVVSFADDTLVLKATVPEPTYELTIPRGSQFIDYNYTDFKLLGDMKVSNVTDVPLVCVQAKYENLKNNANPSDEIALELYCEDEYGVKELISKDGKIGFSRGAALAYEASAGHWGYQSFKLYAKVPNWSGATVGATYEATITYKVITSN